MTKKRKYKRPLVLVGSRWDLEPITEIAEELDIPILGILDRCYTGQKFQGLDVIGSDLDLLSNNLDITELIEYADFFVCTYFSGVTDTSVDTANTFLLRQERIELVKQARCNLTNLIHPDARISKNCQLGRNLLILPTAIVESHVKFGSFGTLMYYSTLAHHSIVGENCTIMPNGGLAGSVVIGNNVTIGVNTKILSTNETTVIGDNVLLGPGLTVFKNVPSNSIVQVNGKILEQKEFTPEFYLENDIGFSFRRTVKT